MAKVVKGPGIDLGELQNTFTITRRTLAASESNLKRAQDARDKARQAASEAESALREATRALLG